jgi:hypothetical protein
MAGDALYNNVALLLHCNGTNGSTAFADNGPTPKTVTANNGAQISTAQSKFGGASGLFDGANDYLTAGSAADWRFLHDDSADFAIECYAYWAGGSSDLAIISTAVASANVGFILQVLGSNSRKLDVQIYRGASGNQLSATSSTGLTAGAWTYFKFSYSKTSRAYEFRIGSSAAGSGTMTVTGTWASSSASDPTYTLAVGRYQHSAPSGYLNGYLDDLRITKAARTDTSEPTRAFSDGLGEVEGVIRDDTNTPCARTVRLYRRDTGALVISGASDATTGAYRLATPTLDEVTRLVLDDASGTLYNDICDRVIPA